MKQHGHGEKSLLKHCFQVAEPSLENLENHYVPRAKMAITLPQPCWGQTPASTSLPSYKNHRADILAKDRKKVAFLTLRTGRAGGSSPIMSGTGNGSHSVLFFSAISWDSYPKYVWILNFLSGSAAHIQFAMFQTTVFPKYQLLKCVSLSLGPCTPPLSFLYHYSCLVLTAPNLLSLKRYESCSLSFIFLIKK